MSNSWSSGIQHHPIRKKFQCKHIPDDLMVCAVLLAPASDNGKPSSWRMRWDIAVELRQLLGEHAPAGLDKIMMAKLAKLERRGILHGCTCGCRGDWHIPNEVFCC
jgi:hypothetical protein